MSILKENLTESETVGKVPSKSLDISTISEREIGSFLKSAGDMVTLYASESWAPVFSQSKGFEAYTIDRCDAMIREQLQEEEGLISQKKAMMEKLALISRSLRPSTESR